MRSLRVGLLIGIALCILAASAGIAAEGETYIYKGSALNECGITAGGWGSGKAAESKEHMLTGNYSVKLTTQSLYSGGRLDFDQPVPLYTGSIDTAKYVVFGLFFADVRTVDPAAETNYSSDAEPYVMPKAGKMRFVFVSAEGQKISVDEPTNPVDPDDNWVRVAVPLSKLKAAGDTFSLKRLLIFTDIPSTIYLGDMRIVTDSAPIKVDSLESQSVAVPDLVAFVAHAQAGISSLVYSWDYDSKNGIQADSTGKIGKYVYTKEGEYVVTLTVSDADGVKAPVSVVASVSVQ